MNVTMSAKVAHELFVTGHSGGAVTEIAAVAAVAPVGVFIRNVASDLLLKKPCGKRVQFAVDVVLLMLPMVIYLTVLADMIMPILVALIAVSCALLVLTTGYRNGTLHLYYNSGLNFKLSGKRPYLSNYRAFVNAATAVIILAVDFQIFPRRFCKTEMYGTGLMDVGVASYIFANAIVSPEARHLSAGSGSAATHLGRSVKSTIPLWVLGFSRFVSVKATDYHEHVTEYGVHWNFFFTLAIVRISSTILQCVSKAKNSWIMAVLVMAIYQTALSLCGLNDYILSESTGRSGILDANREGIFSCCGYLALYFAGVELGYYLFMPRSTMKDWVKTLGVLLAADVIFWLLYACSNALIDAPSRRLANLTYVLWMVAYTLQSVSSFLLADLLHALFIETSTTPPKAGNDGSDTRKVVDEDNQSTREMHQSTGSSPLLEAITYNGLLYFLLANIMTGVVNMTMQTIHASTFTALVVLSAYVVTLSTVTSLLYVHSIRVKFW